MPPAKVDRVEAVPVARLLDQRMARTRRSSFQDDF
jgi:hypothetical protein